MIICSPIVCTSVPVVVTQQINITYYFAPSFPAAMVHSLNFLISRNGNQRHISQKRNGKTMNNDKIRRENLPSENLLFTHWSIIPSVQNSNLPHTPCFFLLYFFFDKKKVPGILHVFKYAVCKYNGILSGQNVNKVMRMEIIQQAESII